MKVVVLSGLAALAATAGIMLATASAAPVDCPSPTEPYYVKNLQVCTYEPIFLGCDPGPCYTSAPQS